MANFRAGMYSYLSADAGLTAAVGGRIYPTLAPSTAPLPYVVYQRIDEEESGHLGGLSGLSRATYQFNIWGRTEQHVETVLQALKLALDRYRGLMGSVPVVECRITSILDGLEPPVEGETQGIPQRTVTADLWFTG